jgi:3'(2'), 5'-bisphosphate nucleotidase
MTTTPTTGPSAYASVHRHMLRVAARAGAIARKVQQTQLAPTLGTVESRDKADASPVTVADYAVQAYVARQLQHAFPDYRFIAEESSAALRADARLLALVVEAVRVAPSDGLAAATADDVLGAIDWGSCEKDGTQVGRCFILGMFARGCAVD